MRKILLATRPLAPPWDEASKNFAYFLAKSIAHPELEVHVLTTPEGLDGMESNIIQHPLYSQSHFDFSQKTRLFHFLALQSQKFDIVHYLFTPTLLNTRLIKLGNQMNVMLNSFQHLKIPNQSRIMSGTGPRDDKLKTIQTIATLREDLFTPDQWEKMFFADRLVVYSDYSKHKLEAAGFEGVERIYPGIDLNLYSPQPKSHEAMKHFNLSENDFIVTYPGEYTRLGATDRLVSMLTNPKLRVTNYELQMKFIFACRVKNQSDAKKKKEVEEKLRAVGMLEHVRFTDTWKDMPTLYNLSDIVVFPVENMRGKFDIPLVITEACACGKPVIVSDLEIFRECTNPNISVIIPTDNPGALTQAIEYLRLNEGKRKAIGQAARKFVETKFNLKDTAQKYEKLYLDLSRNM